MLLPGVSSSPLVEETRDRKGMRRRSKSHSRRLRQTPAHEANSISTVPLYGQSPVHRPLSGTLAFSPRVVGVQGTGENAMISGTIGPGRHRTTTEEVTSPYNSNSGASPRGVVPPLSPSGVFLPNTDQGTVLYPSTHNLFPVNASSYVDPRGIQVSVMIPFQSPGPVAGPAVIDPQTSNGGERVSEGVQTTSGSRRRKSSSLSAVSLPESSPHTSDGLPISHLVFGSHESESPLSHLPHSPAGKDISSQQTARRTPVPSDRSSSPQRRKKRTPRAPSTSHRLANPPAGVAAMERLSERDSGPDEKRVSQEGNPAVAPDGGKSTFEESRSVARESAKLRNATTVQQGRRKKDGGRLETVATEPRQRRGRKAEKMNEMWEERKQEGHERRTASQNHWKESETDDEMQTETSSTNSGEREGVGTEEIHFQPRSKKNAVAKVIVDIRNDITAALTQADGSQSKRAGRQRGIRAVLILFGLLFAMSHVISLHTPDTNLSVWSVSASAVSSVLATSFWLLLSLPWSLFSSDISSLSISEKGTEAPDGRAVNWALARKGALILENETTGLPPRWAAMLSRHLGNVASFFMPTYIAAKGKERWGEPPDHLDPDKTRESRPFSTEPISGLSTVNWSHYFPMFDHEMDASVLLQDTKKQEGTDEKFFHFEGRQGQVAVHLPKRIAVTSIGVETKPLLQGNGPRTSACDPSVPSHVNVFVAVDSHRKPRKTQRRNDRTFIPDMPFEKQKRAENGSGEQPEVQTRTGEETGARSGESNDAGAESNQDWIWVEVGSFAIPCSAAGKYTLHTFPVKRAFSLNAQKAQATQHTKAKQERWEQTDEDAEDDSDSRRHALVEMTGSRQCADEGEERQSGVGKTARGETHCLLEKCVACGLSETECVIADKVKFVLTARAGATCTRLYGLRVLGCDGS